MKHAYSKWILVTALALALALAFGAVAAAEGETAAPAPGAQAAGGETGATPEAGSAEEDSALREAMEAYANAKSASREKDLQSELDAFVADGSLTREQADLIAKYYKDRQALREGVCPNCGYSFGKGAGMGGNRNGGNGFGGRQSAGGRQGFGKGSGMGGRQSTPEAAPAMPGDGSNEPVYAG